MSEGSSIHNDGCDPSLSPCDEAMAGPARHRRLKDKVPAEWVAELRDEIRIVAEAMLASERPGHTLQPTALVNELWLRMSGTGKTANARFDSKVAFMAYASSAIRHILVDHARKKSAVKRGGNAVIERIQFVARDLPGVSSDPIWVLELEEEIRPLEKVDKRCANVFEMRFFGGMTPQEIAECLGVPVREVQRDWKFATTWLATRMKQHDHADT